ncbi:MAG: hypothetical protein WDM76_03245 [Limisphaerales bacterium]
MKKMILTVTAIIALAAASLQSARAGDREWATAGKVLTGVVAADVLIHAVAPQPRCMTYYPAPAPVVYCPPPRPQVVVIHNWSPASYCGPTVVYSSPRPVRYAYASRRGCW